MSLMLSRVAERVYWMARYAERAENIARIINVYTNLLLDLPRNTAIGWHSLVQITGSKELFHELYNEDLERNIMKFLLADTRNPGSLINSLSFARENARTIRGILPREGWEQKASCRLGDRIISEGSNRVEFNVFAETSHVVCTFVNTGADSAAQKRLYAVDDRYQRLRQIRSPLGNRRSVLCGQSRQQLERRVVPLGGKGQPTGEQMEHGRAQRVDVGSMIYLMTVAGLLGGHVVEGPHQPAGAGQATILRAGMLAEQC